MTTTKTETILRNLTAALKENEEFYRTASLNAMSDELRELFRQRAEERAEFAHELAAHTEFTAENAEGLHLMDMLHRGLVTIRAALTIEHDKTDDIVIEESLAAEKELLNAYLEATDAEQLPPGVADIVQRQLASIHSAYAYMGTQSAGTDEQVVLALFTEVAAAEQAVSALVARGISRERIAVVAEETAVKDALEDNRMEMAVEGAGAGAVGVGAFGGIVGLILGTTITLAFGPVLIVGLPAVAGTAALSTAAGASIGSMFGALLGWGVAEDDIHEYIEGVRLNEILLVVHVKPDMVEETAVTLKEANGHKVTTRQEPTPE